MTFRISSSSQLYKILSRTDWPALGRIAASFTFGCTIAYDLTRWRQLNISTNTSWGSSFPNDFPPIHESKDNRTILICPGCYLNLQVLGRISDKKKFRTTFAVPERTARGASPSLDAIKTKRALAAFENMRQKSFT